ncbi:MAG: GNAT family N-acetyltransferase [Armatimonadetes bacterium]|nr:GNAT family N-acetyltransferase [Armatimonadota bacterium]
MEIVPFAPDDLLSSLPQFVSLLQDTVNTGASIGFLPPLDTHTAEVYWRSVASDGTILLAALDGGRVVGSVQLALAGKANARHRAEVQKLMVLTECRGRGLGSRLMVRIEEIAVGHRRSLLVLDTRRGDISESLYRKMGYIEAGVIPEFAQSANGQLHDTVLFYKQLRYEER